MVRSFTCIRILRLLECPFVYGLCYLAPGPASDDRTTDAPDDAPDQSPGWNGDYFFGCSSLRTGLAGHYRDSRPQLGASPSTSLSARPGSRPDPCLGRDGLGFVLGV